MKRSRSNVSSALESLFAAILIALGSLVVFSQTAFGQENPVPFVNQPLVPDATAPGGPDFTLTVNGTGFVPGSVVNWNATALATRFVSGSQLTATVPAANIAGPRTASVTVVNPAPGGGTSNVAFFVVTAPSSSVSFNLVSSPAAGQWAGPVAVGDFNGDGKPDLAVANSSESSIISVLLGNGTGNFATALSQCAGVEGCPGVGGCPDSASVGDFNSDGKLDLAIADECKGVEVLLGNGTGNFASYPNYYNGSASGSGAVCDFNGDGKLDFAVPYREQLQGYYSSGVNILLGDGSGFLYPSSSIAIVTDTGAVDAAVAVAVGDFNGDGRLDLAAVLYGSTAILLGDGTGNFALASSLAYGGNSVAVGDFNGDGKLDLAVVGWNTTSILLGDGTGNFTLASSLPYGGFSVAVGDFNGDGKLDLAVVGGGETASILLGDGTGNFTQASSPSFLGSGGNYTVGLGDFNGDGRLDLAISGAGANTVSILLQPSPEVALSPTTVNFPNQPLGTTSGTQTVTLSNTGTEMLVITAVVATGDYSETNDCGVSVAAQASCSIAVTFSPTAQGTRTGAITIADNAPGNPHLVALTGTGTAPAAALSCTTMSAGSQVVGTASAAQTMTLTNSGNAALNITAIAVSPGSFSQTNTCGASLAAGAKCTITVTFTPSAAGDVSGTLSITDNAPGSPHQVKLSGTGQDFSFGAYNPSRTVSPGSATSYGLGLGPEFGFNRMVSLACSGAPVGVSCTLSPSSTTLNGKDEADITLQVQTSAPAGAAAGADPPLGPFAAWRFAVVGWVLLALAFLIAAPRRRAIGSARLRTSALIPTVALLLQSAFWVACGSSGGYVAPSPSIGTPVGSYVITVTATSGKLGHATTVQLTVRLAKSGPVRN
jgi:FG-GAP-like repeat/Cep192 domain 4/Abnormal spindle-like microcephaly-assoc'd, ASPM-SPD-2-Hydin/FG-GAP repeat